MTLARIFAIFLSICLSITPVLATEPAQCRKVIFADTGASDVTATTAIVTTILQGLNYRTEIKPLTLQATYTALASDQVDVFLGNWMPMMQGYFAPYHEESSIDVVRTNLTGGQYGLATNNAGLTQGIHRISDITAHRKALKNTIFIVKPDNGVRYNLMETIAQDEFKLGTIGIAELSEQGLFAEVERKNKQGKAIVFLAWKPHPMNARIEPIYLSGSDEILDTTQNAAEVQTITRAGYTDECKNTGVFLKNLGFAIDTQRELMEQIYIDGMEPTIVAKKWLKKNPEKFAVWLDGVTTYDGNDPHSAMKFFLDEEQ